MDCPDRADPGSIERVATCVGFAMNGGEIRIDRQAWMGVRFETVELGMGGIAARFAAKDRPGQ